MENWRDVIGSLLREAWNVDQLSEPEKLMSEGALSI